MTSVEDLLGEATVDIAAGHASQPADTLAAARIHRIKDTLVAVLSEIDA